MAFPSMLARFVNVLCSIVDRMHIGNIEGIGVVVLVGVGIYGSVMTLISSLTSWTGVGGIPLMSIRLGQKNERVATQMVANCFTLLTRMASIIAMVTFLLKEPLLTFFGTSPTTLLYANEYMSWYLLGTVFALLSVGINQFTMCQGFAKVGMKPIVLGAVSNIVLDPILIFYLNMGVREAAIAMVISQMAPCIYVLILPFGRGPPMRITFGGYRWNTMKQVLTVGLSPFFITAFDSLLIIVINMMVSRLVKSGDGDMLLTCNTTVQSFMLLITMSLGGIIGGTQTVLSHSHEAGRPGRTRRTEKYIVVLGLVFTVVMSITTQVDPGCFIRILIRESSYVGIMEWAIRIYTLYVTPLAVQYTMMDEFTGMGIAKVVVSLPVFRKLVYLLSVLFLPMVFGVKRVSFVEPASDITTCMTSTATYPFLNGGVLGDHKGFRHKTMHKWEDGEYKCTDKCLSVGGGAQI